MNHSTFQAVLNGHRDSLLDQQMIAVQSGFWSAYYTNSKHPKSVQKISEAMVKNHNKVDAQPSTKSKPDVDVDAFLRREEAFKNRLLQQG